MAHVDIYATTMGFHVGVTQNGLIKGTGVLITEFSRQFENWKKDPLTNQWQLTEEYFHFYRDLGMCYFARFALQEFIDLLKNRNVDHTLHVLEGEHGRTVRFHMLPFVQFKNDRQKEAIEYLTDPNSGPTRALALQTGGGKAQPLYSRLKTPTGWIQMGDVKLDDDLQMPDGSVARVTGIFPQGKKAIYEITLEGYRKTQCCLEHLWKYYADAETESYDVVKFEEILAKFSRGEDVYIPITYDTLTAGRRKLIRVDYVGEHEAQCISVGHPDHLYITDDYIVTHNTVSYIWSLQKLHRRSMITMTSRLDQWVPEILKYTTCDESDIYVIQGVGSLTKLFNQIEEINPKIIIASTATIRLYLEYGPNYQHLPHPTKMCEALEIGIVGTDEFHEHFHTNFVITSILNPSIFIPITATFTQNDKFSKSIFDRVIPENIKFTGGEYRKYINVTMYKYTHGHLEIKPWNYTSRKMYSQIKLEEFLLSKRGSHFFGHLLELAIIPIVERHYIDIADKGERFLMLCSTKALCDEFAKIFKKLYKDKTVIAFHSGMNVSNLEKHDMIISTPGSAGTGRDIKNLRTCFVFVNTESPILNEQFLGRTRDFPAVQNTPEFQVIGFTAIPQHLKYYNKRSILYGPRAKTLTHRSI